MATDLSIVDEVEASVRAALADDYRIEGLLGRGGMSVVFLARELALNRLLALKVLPLKLAEEATAAERFQQEATIAASLDHPHVSPIHRFGTTSAFHWYTMKYIRGQSLDEALRDIGRLGLHSCLSLVEQTASALEHAHRRGIVHRDMKPSNVMLDENSWVYVCDFGVAKAAGNVKLTQTGGTIGTPAYMSPEQLYGQPLDGRSDQYSLAVMTFELLTGRHPFVADSVGEIIRMHCSEPAPSLDDFRPDLPDRVVDGVKQAMSKKPAERFDSVIDYLTAIGGRRPPRAPEPRVSVEVSEAITEPLPARARGRRHAGHLVWAVAALALVLIGGAVLTDGDRPLAAVQEPVTPAGVGAFGQLWVQANIMVDDNPVASWGELYIDGAHIGRLPAIQIPIGAGDHMLRISRDGYRPYERRIHVPAGGEARFTDIVLEPQP